MKKLLLLSCGWISLAVGFIGIFLPILPTTPLVVLAALCFSASSPKAYAYLCRNRFFGPYIINYRTKQGVSPAAKARGIIAVWCLLGISALAMQKVWAYVLFSIIGIGVTIHLLMLKTAPKNRPPQFPAPEKIRE